jgi:tape measure domain-containing protein
MATNIGAVAVNLGLNTASFNQKLRGANDNLQSAGAKWNRTAAKSQRAFTSFNRSIGRTARQMVSLTAVAATLGAVLSVRKLVNYSDTYKQLDARVKLVTNSTAEFNRVQEELFSIAQNSRTSLESTTQLYTRFARATKDTERSQKDLLIVTDAISKAVTVSGASATSAGAALFQLSQGLAADALRGQELNSVLEQTPRVAEAIADGMGVAVGELRGLAEDGALTAETVLNAIKSQADIINGEFQQIPKTVGQAFQQLDNAFLRFIGKSSAVEAGTNSLAIVISSLANNIDILVRSVLALAVVLSRNLVASAFAAANSFRVMAVQSIAVQASLARMGGVAAGASTAMATLGFASRGLSLALGAIGGPIGLAAIAAIFLLSSGTDKAAAAQRLYLEATAASTQRVLESISVGKERIAQLKEEQRRSIDASKAQLELAKARLTEAKAQAAQQDLSTFAATRGAVLPGTIKRAGPAAAQDRIKQLEQQLRQQEADLGRIGAGLATGALSGGGKAAEKEAKAIEKVVEQLKFKTEQLQRTNQQQELYEKLRAAGVSIDSQAGKEIEALIGRYQNLEKAQEDAKDKQDEFNGAIDSFGKSSASAFEDAILGAQSFGDALSGVFQDLQRQLLRRTVTDPLGGLLGDVLGAGSSSSGGSGGGLLGGLLAAVGLRAEGGPVSANKPYIVGERGPELIIPTASGTVIPNDMLGSGAGRSGVSSGGQPIIINQSINVTTGVQQTVAAEMHRFMPQIKQVSIEAIRDAQNRGALA